MAPKSPAPGFSPPDRGPGPMIVVRVIKAVLFRSFDKVESRMDPFATVSILEGDKEKGIEVGRTKSAWGQDKTPRWDHTCRGCPYAGPKANVRVKVRVSEENWGGMMAATFCGEAISPVEDLLRGLVQTGSGLMTSEPIDLKLIKKGEHTGDVTIQIMKNDGKGGIGGDASGEAGTAIAPGTFLEPIKPIKVSGGTAPFFLITLAKPKNDQPPGFFIGKDLSRATDEVDFYETVLKLRRTGGADGLDAMFEFMFQYDGIIELKAEGQDAPVKLLVLENLFCGYKKLRMCDIKMGERTCCAGWQGKSRFRAMKQSLLDEMTNSPIEGFRVEGFDNPPPGITSMDPLLDIVEKADEKKKKKAFRLMLQRFKGADLYKSLLDVHEVPADISDAECKKTLSPIEYAEIVMSQIVRRLAKLCIASRSVAAPQKWIGSSVALGFDADWLPPRSTNIDDIRKKVVVKIFDWGRSELNSLEKHAKLSAEQQADRIQYWQYYSGGCDRLAFEAARAYAQRFGNHAGWSHARFTVYDFDAMSANDIIGTVTVELKPTAESTLNIYSDTAQKQAVSGSDREETKITYSITWRDFPAGSRLKGAWRVKVHKITNVPKADLMGLSDPFVTVAALCEGKAGLTFSQDTQLVANNHNPEFNEVFDIPVAASPNLVSDTLRAVHVGFEEATRDAWHELFPPPPADTGGDEHPAEKSFDEWKMLLQQFAGKGSFMYS